MADPTRTAIFESCTNSTLSANARLLIKIDMVNPMPAKAPAPKSIFQFILCRRPIAGRSGGNEHVRAQPAFGDRLADDLLGTAESVDRAVSTMLMPCSNADRMVATDSASSVPPHIQPPMAQVPIATGDTLSEVPGISLNSKLGLRVSA